MHPICVTCGVQFARLRAAAGGLSGLCRRAAVRGLGGAAVDHARGAAGRASAGAAGTRATGCSGSAASPALRSGSGRCWCRRSPKDGPGRNLLWDCISLIDEAAVRVVEAAGGLGGIAISHPHFYSSMVEWSRAFGGVPIWLHADDWEWVMRPDPAIRFWGGGAAGARAGARAASARRPFCGRSGAALGGWRRWPRRAALHGDIVQVVQDRRFVSFMRFFPNLIPLPATAVRADRGEARALRVRADLWRLVRSGGPPGWQGRAPPLGRTLSAGAGGRRVKLPAFAALRRRVPNMTQASSPGLSRPHGRTSIWQGDSNAERPWQRERVDP